MLIRRVTERHCLWVLGFNAKINYDLLESMQVHIGKKRNLSKIKLRYSL